jgi:hypothetical protein
MKKLLIFLLAFCALILICFYVFIPGKLTITKVEYMNCNVNGAFRILSTQSNWGKWWPNKDSLKSNREESSFFYNGYNYRLTNKYYNSVEVFMEKGHDSIESRINIIKINPDSVVLEWKCILPAGFNPVTRILNYLDAKIIKKNMDSIFSKLQMFLQKKENVYGVNFHVTMSKDSTMVAIKNMSTNYPSTSDIYNLVGILKKYIKNEGANENNFPMLNVRKKGAQFETMVAIPVNRELADNGKIFFSRFVPWKVLTGEVKGGTYTVNEALHQMGIYIADYQKTAMAIPFQSLVTNRMEESDTLKWITRIYTPVP